tara:strand:+ start:3698 stop:4612 length:915 start_codon:yes stop_codon:yes gene_type:complete
LTNHKRYYYQVFGWNIASEIELQELWQGDETKAADIIIKENSLPLNLEGAVKKGIGFQIKPGHYFLHIEEVAKYHVIEGKEIQIDRYQGADLNEIKVFLYASVFGGLCHLRDVLPLHASAIMYKNSSYLFTGNTGAGKSTTVAKLQQKGYTVLTDDLAPISFNANGLATISQGISRIKLWEDAFEKINIPYSEKNQIRSKIKKYHSPIETCLGESKFPVKTIFVLEPYSKSELTFTELVGKEKGVTISKHIYRTQLIGALGLKEAHFKKVAFLLQQVKVIRVNQPRKINKLEEFIERIEEYIKS